MNYDIEISQLAPLIDELESAFDDIQMARTPFQLRNFVIGQHDTIEQQYAQCVLEMQIKWQNLRRAQLNKRRLELEIERLLRHAENLDEKGDWDSENKAEQTRLKAAQKEIDIEDQNRAAIGAVRELKSLYEIWKTDFPKKFSREELNEAQPEYWQKRLTRQAEQDVIAYGRLQVGNQEAMKQAGLSVSPARNAIEQTEANFLAMGDIKILIVVPTEEKAVDGLPCVEGIVTPSGCQIKYFNVFGRKVDDAYNEAVWEAINDSADYMFTVEDDTFPPKDALVKLMRYFDDGDKLIVGGWYPKRQPVPEGAPIVVRNGRRRALEADDKVHEVYTITQGCTLFPVSAFTDTTAPWFVTTKHLTQDSFFSQKARDAGYTLLCDTSIRCKHVDRVTGDVYE